jgi:hypothetical protein
VVQGLCDSTKISEPITVKTAPEITISSHPTGAIKCKGDNITFTVTATSSSTDEPIGYRWKKNGVLLSDAPHIIGARSNTLTINGLEVSDAGDYEVEIYYINLGAGIKSNTATLTVGEPPTITSITGNGSAVWVDRDDDLQLVVEVSSPTNYTYQWSFNGTILPINTNVYVVPQASVDDEGVYTILITNNLGCGQTEATIEVKLNTSIFEYSTQNFRILSVVPNPVTNEASVNFVLPDAQTVILSLVDATGKFVSEIHSGFCVEGMNTIRFDEKLLNISSGTYFVVLESNDKKTSYKISVNK